MFLRRLAGYLPAPLANAGRKLYHQFVPQPVEPLMYRVHLFRELLDLAGAEAFTGGRVLEIGPRDGLDSKRIAGLGPAELVMIDLPEKRGVTAAWLPEITCPHRYIEANFMYMPADEVSALGAFRLIWCTGVIYHNAEQLRFLRKLYKRLDPGGYLVLESSTLRQPWYLRKGNYVQLHFPETFRNTGTVTHLPTARAIKTWLQMVGFKEIRDSACFEPENRNVRNLRMACISRKTDEDDASVYYGKSGLNPDYRFGDSV